MAHRWTPRWQTRSLEAWAESEGLPVPPPGECAERTRVWLLRETARDAYYQERAARIAEARGAARPPGWRRSHAQWERRLARAEELAADLARRLEQLRSDLGRP